jgi:hypothetical protein
MGWRPILSWPALCLPNVQTLSSLGSPAAGVGQRRLEGRLFARFYSLRGLDATCDASLVRVQLLYC